MNRYRIIGYLRIPGFYLQLHSLFYPGKRQENLAVGGTTGAYGIILEASPPVMQKGVRPGMACSQAQALAPGIRIVEPDNRGYARFMKKITRILSDFSLKWIKDRYDAFYLFLPDYYSLLPAIRQVQDLIRERLNIRTSMGLSVNKYVARLAAGLARPGQAYVADRSRAPEMFRACSVDELEELTPAQREGLKLAGIRFLHQLLFLTLNEMKFILDGRAEFI